MAKYRVQNAAKLGTGTYGAAYSVPVQTAKRMLDHLRNKIKGMSLSDVTGNVVVKVMCIRKLDVVHPFDGKTLKIRIKEYFERTVQEYRARRVTGGFTQFATRMADANPQYHAQREWMRVLETGTEDALNHAHLAIQTESKHSPASVVPKFYGAGSSDIYGVYVIVMSVARGKSIKGRHLSMQDVAYIERAFLILMAGGLDHADSHRANIYLDESRTKVTIIDFGVSVRLPPALAKRAKDAVANVCSNTHKKNKEFGELWSGRNSVKDFTVPIMQSRGFNFYNPTNKAMISLWIPLRKKALESSSRAELDKTMQQWERERTRVRQVAWACNNSDV